MFCSNCATALPPDSIACYRCSAPTNGWPTVKRTDPNSTLKIVALVLGVVVVLPILFFSGLLMLGMYSWNQVERAGEETSAAQTMKNLKTFQTQYESKYKGNFATFDELIYKVGLDEQFSGDQPVVHGYVFRMNVFPPSVDVPGGFFSVTADPKASGGKHFYTDSRIRTITSTSDDRQATSDDPVYP